MLLFAREQPVAVTEVAQIEASAYDYRYRPHLELVYRPKACQLRLGWRPEKSSD